MLPPSRRDHPGYCIAEVGNQGGTLDYPVDICWDITPFSVSMPTIYGIPPESRLEDSIYLEGPATCHLDRSCLLFISILQQTLS
jgi:hypothetical protein